MHRIVDPNALADGVGEDRPDERHAAIGDTTIHVALDEDRNQAKEVAD